MKSWRILSRAARRCALFATLATMACGGESPTKPMPASISRIVLSPASAAIGVGNTVTVIATPLDSANGILTGRTISWSSNNTSVATVAPSGVVTGVATGAATITASAENKSATLAVTVAPTHFAVVDAQFTQGVQYGDGSIPMVIGDRAAVVNVMVGALATATSAPQQIVLRLFNANGTLIRTDTALTGTQFTASPSTAAPSAQFLVPANRLQNGVRWQVERDPKHLVRDDSEADDIWPRTGTASLLTTNLNELSVRFVPITLAQHNNSTAVLTNSQLSEFTRTLESLMPLSTLTTAIAPPLTTQANFGAPPRGGDLPFWSQVLSELDLARMLAASASRTYWMGVVIPPSGYNFTIYGGVGYVPISGAQTAARTRTSMVVGPNWYSNPTGARDGVAHELGHNFGRLHAPCGGVTGSFDTNYPTLNGFIGTPGHDVFSWSKGFTTAAPVIGPSTGDIMGYCQQPWISPYTYEGALDFRRAEVILAAIAEPAVQPVLIVQGSVDGNEITLQPAFSATTRTSLPDAIGNYRLEGLDGNGRVLFAHSFVPTAIDHALNLRHFTFALPQTGEIQQSLSVLRVSSGSTVVRAERRSNSTARLSIVASGDESASAVSITRNASNAVVASCKAPGTQGILVQDNPGALLATNASSASAVFSAPAGTTAQVQCSDGVKSVSYRVRVP